MPPFDAHPCATSLFVDHGIDFVSDKRLTGMSGSDFQGQEEAAWIRLGLPTVRMATVWK
jgi:hypothetical protein